MEDEPLPEPRRRGSRIKRKNLAKTTPPTQRYQFLLLSFSRTQSRHPGRAVGLRIHHQSISAVRTCRQDKRKTLRRLWLTTIDKVDEIRQKPIQGRVLRLSNMIQLVVLQVPTDRTLGTRAVVPVQVSAQTLFIKSC